MFMFILIITALVAGYMLARRTSAEQEQQAVEHAKTALDRLKDFLKHWSNS